MNVLLVDDEPAIRKMTRRMLESGGFQVLEAVTAADALAISETQPIDILVTDIVLEESEGIALSHTLLERHPGLPVLFISGYPMDLEAELRRNPRCAFLPKPYHRPDLLAAVSALLGM
jgi:CheY-like chemotaxis protein